MIEGIRIVPLGEIPDERGCVLHMMRCDDPVFEKFGEIYFSCIYPGAIKGWHLHRRMALNYAVIVGMVKLVLYDDRESSPTRGEISEIFLGEQNYQLVHIPPLVWNGLKGCGDKMAIVANCATLPHDPEEIERLDPFTDRIKYDWGLRHG